MKKSLRLVMLLTLITFLLPSVAQAATGRVSTTNVTNLYNSYNSTKKTWNELKTAKHRLNNKYVTYCLQHKSTFPDGDSYNLTDVFDNYSAKVQKGMRIIVENGYPFDNHGLSAAQAEYATANAIRFWLSECGDSQFYPMTNLGGFSNSQLRLLAASGTITKKIQARNASYIPALQLSVELLIMARAQVLMEHSLELSGDFFIVNNMDGSYTETVEVTTINLHGGYVLDSSELPTGSSITGYTGQNGDVLRISIPASEATANRTYSIYFTGRDNRVRENIAAYNHNKDLSYQRVLCVGTDDKDCAYATLGIYTGDFVVDRPDLIVSTLTSESTSYEIETPMRFTATIHNKGTASAAASNAGIDIPDIGVLTQAIPSLDVGESANVIFEAIAPNIAQTLTVTAYADYNDTIEESDETNNIRRMIVSITEPIPLPDITVTSIQTSKSSYNAGDEIAVYVTIKNQGEADADSFDVRFSVEGFSPSIRKIEKLDAGWSSTLEWTMPAPVLAQTETRNIVVWADSEEIIIESDETNNGGTGSLVINASKPDLIVSSVEPLKDGYEAEQTASIRTVIKNQGLIDAGTFTVSLSIEGIGVQKQTVSELGVDASTTLTWNFTAPLLYNTTYLSLHAWADCNELIDESDEDNNTRSGSIRIIGAATDIAISAITTDAAEYSANAAGIISTEIENRGKLATGDFTMSVVIDGVNTQKRAISSIAPGASVSENWSFKAPILPETQMRSITAWADCEEVIIESDEDNNHARTQVKILGEKPDLEVTDLQTDLSSYAPGDTVKITVTIKNNGIIACPSSELRLSGEGITMQEVAVSQLPANRSVHASFNVTAPSIVGEKQIAIQAHADPDNLIAEKNENNNVRNSSFTVRNYLPDLAVEVRTNKEEYRSGERGIAYVTVKNQGKLAISDSRLNLSIGTFFNNTKQTGAISIGGRALLQFPFTAPEVTQDKSFSIKATVDPANEISESDETNNSATASITVLSALPDLGIISTNADNWFAGMDVVVTATITNYSDQDVPSVDVRLTMDGRSYTESIPLPAQGSNLAVFRVTLPNRTGNVDLRFVADPDNLIEELDKGNNDLSRTIRIVPVPEGIVLDPEFPELQARYKETGIAPIPSTENVDEHIWQEIRLENGAYVTKTYWAKLETSYVVKPDRRIAYEDKPQQMESGFGVEVQLQTQITSNYDHPEKLVGAQLAWTYSPENGYGQEVQWADAFDALETIGGSAGDKVLSWQLRTNPWSKTESRLHYTPLWFPDEAYILLNRSFYAWSPAGQMMRCDSAGVNILGDMYDRVTAVQER